MYPLELSKEKVTKFHMELFQLDLIKHNEKIDDRKTCPELPAVWDYPIYTLI